MLRQSLFVVLTVLVVGGGFVIAAILLSDSDSVSTTSRYVAYGILGVIVLILVVWRLRRRSNRQSLDVALRSRRDVQTP